jgi:hypothetical protein
MEEKRKIRRKVRNEDEKRKVRTVSCQDSFP